ncbi:unnamed protein product [Coregonus sp. 'balchen']|nr:unnamed protein product [Coregonus sp. 'balchen']
MGEVELSCLAYVKMYLHACLFPRCSVNGLLLSSSPAGGAVCVTDCVPLLHSHLPLAPITQLALTQIDSGKMSPDYRVPPIVMYERKDTRWTLKDKHTIMLRQWEETREIASQLLVSGDHSLLVDFDSHLDDITRDWTNQKLNAKIAELASPANSNV